MKQPIELDKRLTTIQETLDLLLTKIEQGEKNWLTAEEAGQRLGYGKQQIYELIRSNRGFPHVQLWEKGEFRIPVKAFEEWIEQQVEQNVA